MTMKQQDPATTFPTVCGQCGVDAHPFLLHLRHRGLFRRLCTTCVLRANLSLFCPTCFQIYDDSIATNTVTCSNCSSISHSSCLGPNPSKPYICPFCTNRFSPIFNWKNKEIDKKSASALLAAAKISVDTIEKAAALAMTEAEKKAREAATTRRRAKEAIQHLECIQENLKKESKGLGFGTNQRIGIAVGERNLFGDGIRMDNSSAVLAALNAVELKEKEKQGVKPNTLLGVDDNAVVPMEIRENGWAKGVGSDKKTDGLGHQVVRDLDVRQIDVVATRAVVQNNHPRQENGGPYYSL